MQKAPFRTLILGREIDNLSPHYGDISLFDEHLTSVTINPNITHISKRLFYGCTSIDSIYIPNRVTTIETSAFEKCLSLKNIIIPNSVEYIYPTAFKGCKSLSTVTISEKVVQVRENVFSDCPNLKEITSLKKIPPVIMDNTFDELTNEYATLYVPYECKTIYWLHPYWERFFNIEELEPTQVDPIITNKKGGITDSHVYNLSGQRMPVKADEINSLPKGIYIVNGKKVAVK